MPSKDEDCTSGEREGVTEPSEGIAKQGGRDLRDGNSSGSEDGSFSESGSSDSEGFQLVKDLKRGDKRKMIQIKIRALLSDEKQQQTEVFTARKSSISETENLQGTETNCKTVVSGDSTITYMNLKELVIEDTRAATEDHQPDEVDDVKEGQRDGREGRGRRRKSGRVDHKKKKKHKKHSNRDRRSHHSMSRSPSKSRSRSHSRSHSRSPSRYYY